MGTKSFTIVEGDISDGYHTFGELYDHRCLLFITLMNTFWNMGEGKQYWVREHFPDWDLLVMESPIYGQISYHVPKRYRRLYESSILECPSGEHKFDGHTPADVLKRLELICEDQGLINDEK